MTDETTKPTAAELREQKKVRVEAEQAQMAEARERAAAEAALAEGADAPDAPPKRRGGARATAQVGIFDKVIEDKELENALEQRQGIKDKQKALNGPFKEADEKAKGLIAKLDIERDVVVRVGRFTIEKGEVAARHVEFDTDGTERLKIAPLGGD